MARLQTIYDNRLAQAFRAIVRPAMFGRIGAVEPAISQRMAEAMIIWFLDVVYEVSKDTKIKDEHGHVYDQLRSGIRVTGASSMLSLRGRIDVYPWLVAHEFGADIKPKGKFLTIPIFYALRPDGRPKFRSATAWKRYGSFIYTSKNTGKQYIAYKSASGELRILYVLETDVKIIARLGLNKMADDMLGELLALWAAIWTEEAFAAGFVNPFIGEV